MVESHIVIGTGGHAQILIETLQAQDKLIIGATERSQLIESNVPGIEILGDDDCILEHDPNDVKLVNGLGWVPGSHNKRKTIFERFEALGYVFLNLVSDSANISKSANLHLGVQVLSGAVIQTGSLVGANTIINTQSSIDHHCSIGSNCHIAPGATICGNVKVGDNTFIGAGAIVINNIEVGDNCVIGAGVTIKENLPHDSRYT
tara:strand:- start:983 stop:1594 length:612 start_codon:yes stop_codon:yes gene_type:complete